VAYKTLIAKYNNTYHKTVLMAPSDVYVLNEELLLDTVYNHLKITHKPKFKVDDYVRISKYKHVFEKGYTPNWTTEIFQIKRIQNTNPITYILKDYQENDIKGGFYEFPDTYLVEKVITSRNGRAFVKWLGFSSEHNSWIDL